MGKHEQLTQEYSTWGQKLLQHTDVLFKIQNEKQFKPITVQLAPTEPCESDCAFCSVSERPLKSVMPWMKIFSTLNSFRFLGAKSVEITGGGNPMLYRDEGRDINDIIELAHEFGFEVGIITNSHDLKVIKPSNYDKISWIRISLIKLDEGKEPSDYNFRGFSTTKIGLSYIIYSEVKQTPRLGVYREGTTENTIHRLAQMIDLHPKIKFVRIAGDCLIKGGQADVRERWGPVIDVIDRRGKFFVKDIGLDDNAYREGCYVGVVRPYVAPSPDGDGEYYVYICTSHVLSARTYDKRYALCHVDNIIERWKQMNIQFRVSGFPYQVDNNRGCNWNKTCKFCYYAPNNRILHAVANDLPDKNFA
ncbi:MAG: radical SAM protein [Candidatus Thorarchaeota archaeon]|jgi:hypothetical protein